MVGYVNLSGLCRLLRINNRDTRRSYPGSRLPGEHLNKAEV